MALLTPGGEVLCRGRNEYGQLGVGDRAPHEGLILARLPWAAAAVSCGYGFSVALRRGGDAVCSWGCAHGGRLGRDGVSSLPGEVRGLPPGDPIVLLEAGDGFVIAVTEGGEAYGWGWNGCGQLALGFAGHTEVGTPVRIASLSCRGLRRLACGGRVAFAETDRWEVLGWGALVGRKEPLPVPLLPRAGRIAFPLRCLAASWGAAAAADWSGRLWCLWDGDRALSAAAGLRGPERVVRVAGSAKGTRSGKDARAGAWSDAHFVALTAGGRLWGCAKGARGRYVAVPGPPQGLLPCGGSYARRIAIVPDACGNKARLHLFAHIAVRLGLLSEPVLVSLVSFMVNDIYITGPAHCPFRWPSGTPPALAAD